MQPSCILLMPTNQGVEVEAGNSAVLDRPSSGHHHPVGAMGAAQDQRGDRVAMPGKPYLIEFEQGEIGGATGGQNAEIVPSKAAGRAGGGKAKRIPVTDDFGAVGKPLQQEGGADFLDEVGAVGRGRAVDAEADGGARLFQERHRTDAGRQQLVAARAMADAGAGLAQPGDFGVVEMDAMGQPHAMGQPAAIFQIIERPQPNRAWQKAFSSFVSAKWVCSRTSNFSAISAVLIISERVTENGEQGASAIWIIAFGPL